MKVNLDYRISSILKLYHLEHVVSKVTWWGMTEMWRKHLPLNSLSLEVPHIFVPHSKHMVPIMCNGSWECGGLPDEHELALHSITDDYNNTITNTAIISCNLFTILSEKYYYAPILEMRSQRFHHFMFFFPRSNSKCWNC